MVHGVPAIELPDFSRLDHERRKDVVIKACRHILSIIEWSEGRCSDDIDADVGILASARSAAHQGQIDSTSVQQLDPTPTISMVPSGTQESADAHSPSPLAEPHHASSIGVSAS